MTAKIPIHQREAKNGKSYPTLKLKEDIPLNGSITVIPTVEEGFFITTKFGGVYAIQCTYDGEECSFIINPKEYVNYQEVATINTPVVISATIEEVKTQKGIKLVKKLHFSKP